MVNYADVQLLMSAFHGDAHRVSVCSVEAERDISRVLIGAGLGCSETSREQAKVHRTLQPNWEKGWREK